MGAVAVGLVASAGVGATICWSGCRCCRSTGWRRPGLSAARSAPTATATAVGTRPTSCWCAGRWRGPTATGRWGRCHRRCLMRMGVYARVSTSRQAQAQTIEQQLERLRAAVCERGWVLDEEHVYRDDGYSGASLGRPGLDRLRDHAALADLDVVLVVAPDRLARNYVHQVLLVDELARHGCRVEFLDRPMSQDPHDQLLLQIRGAVAEYERTLIAERMRRGRQARLRAGTLLPWTRAPFGYRVDPQRPGEVAGVRVEPDEAVLVAQLFDWYLEAGVTLYRLAKWSGPEVRRGLRWSGSCSDGCAAGQMSGVEVQAAGAVQGVLGGASKAAGGQHGILIAVLAGQVDRKPPACRRPAIEPTAKRQDL